MDRRKKKEKALIWRWKTYEIIILGMCLPQMTLLQTPWLVAALYSWKTLAPRDKAFIGMQTERRAKKCRDLK